MCYVAGRRRGSQDVEVSLEVEVDNQPERYTLSASLSAVLGLKQATRASVLQALWTYIKSNRLQVFSPTSCTPTYLPTYLPTCAPAHPSACLPVYPSSRLPVCLFAFLSSYP